MHARIKLHAEIHCDGGHGGHLEGVVLDPVHRHATHLVIRAPDGHRHVVTARAIAEAHHGYLVMALTVTDLLATPRFVERDLSLPASPTAPPAPLDPDALLYPGDRIPAPDFAPTPLPVEHVAVSPGEFAVTDGTPVHCTDRACGHVTEVLLDPANAHAEGLLVRQGFLMARDVELPLGWIERVDQAGVHLKMSSIQVDDLARCYPQDAD